MSVLDVVRDGAVLILTIDRPEAFNALNAEVVAALRDQVAAAESDDDVRAVVVTGSGQKAFSAGADLKELSTMGSDRAADALDAGQAAFRAIESATVPVIAAVNGLALGGGFELVLASTFAVVSTRATMGLPESSLGLIPGYGGTQRLPRLVGEKVAAHLMLTGSRLDAGRAYELGITPVTPVEPDELVSTALEIASTIAAQGPRAAQSILRAIEMGRDASLDAGLQMETGLAALAVAGEESTEGIGAFLERRSPNFVGVEGVR